jgi:hypothetical protein
VKPVATSTIATDSCCHQIPTLTRCNIAISNNGGDVKHFLSTLLHALEEERQFALVGGLRFPTWARF